MRDEIRQQQMRHDHDRRVQAESDSVSRETFESSLRDEIRRHRALHDRDLHDIQAARVALESTLRDVIQKLQDDLQGLAENDKMAREALDSSLRDMMKKLQAKHKCDFAALADNANDTRNALENYLDKEKSERCAEVTALRLHIQDQKKQHDDEMSVMKSSLADLIVENKVYTWSS